MEQKSVFKEGNPFDPVHGYTKGRVLGSGGFGTVYLCENRITGLRVAIKMSNESLILEMTVATSCSCKYILTPMELWYDDTTYFLVMPIICPASRVDFRKCSIRERISFFQQLALAANHMHQKGWKHLDITRFNIGFDVDECEKRYLKLIDFGLSEPIGGEEAVQKGVQLPGMAAYKPPEFFKENRTSYKNDVWSVCLLGFEMLVGLGGPYMHLGLENPSNFTVFFKVSNLKRFDIPELFIQYDSEFVKYLLKILQTGLSMNPEERNLDEILVELEKMLLISLEQDAAKMAEIEKFLEQLYKTLVPPIPES